MNNCRFGFWIQGSTRGQRQLVDAAAAFSAFAGCDMRARVERESYLSAFNFGDDFRRLINETGSPAGFDGACWSPWLWFDIDREGDLDRAVLDARQLAVSLDERYCLAGGNLLLFFSGGKGYHIALPTSLWSPEPSRCFHKVCRRLAETLAERIGVRIDSGIYDRVRAFRAPNSRHAKSGLHKRVLTLDELLHLSTSAIVERAQQPEPFDLPDPPMPCKQAVADWEEASQAVERQIAVNITRRNANGAPTLNHSTRKFIREGADEGDRHRLLFSAAANLAEFGCSFDLAFALLSEAALDSGLPPKEVRRQIGCGLAAVAPLSSAAMASPPNEVSEAPTPSVAESLDAQTAANLRDALAQLWERTPAGDKTEGSAS